MNLISASRAAEILGVSPQRVRALIKNDQLVAHNVGGRWLVDPASMPAQRRRAGQPFSPRIAWSLADLASGHVPKGLSLSELSRCKARLRALAESSDPAVILASAMARRARQSRWSAPEPFGLLKDERVVAGGRSDPRAGIRDSQVVEVYVRARDLDGVVGDHLLVAARESPNVVLRAVDGPLDAPLPWLIVASDLAEGNAREVQQAERLVREYDVGR